MYQANINPQAHEHLTPEQWTEAVDRLEKNLGFEGHQRIVVEHEKEGRAHRHVIWNRVDEEFRTVSPFFNYLTHERTARELEREFGLEQLVENGRARETIQLWEQQRGEQTQIDPHEVKAEVTQLWRETSSGVDFWAGLEERGYILAQGDRRDFVIVDHAGTVHSLARRIEGARAADVRERMADVDRDELPSVEEARAEQRERYLDAAEAFANRPNKIEIEIEPSQAESSRERPPRHDATDLAAGAVLAPIEKIAEAFEGLIGGGPPQLSPKELEQQAIRQAEAAEARNEQEFARKLETSREATKSQDDKAVEQEAERQKWVDWMNSRSAQQDKERDRDSGRERD